ncbi:hypothetical protein ACFLXQ_04710 [Chloroflexota bacterium]
MTDKSSNGGKQKMVMTGFRIAEYHLEQARTKAGLVSLSKYFRTLVLMWLNGEIKVTEEDIKKYDE